MASNGDQLNAADNSVVWVVVVVVVNCWYC